MSLCLFTNCSFHPFVESTLQEGLIVDDFSTKNNRWDVRKWEDGSTIGYYQKGLIFIINSPYTDAISTMNKFYSDVRIEAVAENANGLMDNGFGLVCRYQDDTNYYAFLVSSDGYYGILRVLYGGYAILNGGELQYSDFISQGKTINHIRADCVGNQLTLYVNNQILAQVQDEVFSEGKVGLMVSSFAEPGVAILFDNFTAVRQQ